MSLIICLLPVAKASKRLHVTIIICCVHADTFELAIETTVLSGNAEIAMSAPIRNEIRINSQDSSCSSPIPFRCQCFKHSTFWIVSAPS